MPSPTILSALLTAQGSQFDLTAQHLLNADDDTLFQMLPVLMAFIQRIAQTSNDSRSQMLRYLRRFRTRVTACRWIKLRFLLLANHPAFAFFWALKRVHRTNAYVTSPNHLPTQLEESLSIAPPKVEEQAPRSLVRRNATGPLRQVEFKSHGMLSPSDMQDFAANNLFSGDMGMSLKTDVYNNRQYHNVFVASVLIDELQHRINLNKRSDAVMIAQRFLDYGIIHPVNNRSRTFVDSKRVKYHYWNFNSQDEETTPSDLMSSGAVNVASDANVMSHSILSHEAVRRVEIRIPMDTIDLQSFDFWTKGIYLKKPEVGFRYHFCSVTHPLSIVGASQPPVVTRTASQDAKDGEPSRIETEEVGSTEDLNQSDEIVQSMVVKKVFSSLAQPMIVELQKPFEDGDVTDDNQYMSVQPSVLVKSGDNLMQDLGVQIMFRCFNHLWEFESRIREKHGVVPICVGYEVFPTSAANGFMEAVTDLKSLKDFDWKSWEIYLGGCERSRNEMLRSTVGSYIGTYILGGRDRHYDNILIRSKMHLLHIDFSYVLGKKPPIDGPALSIAPQMEISFRKVGIWDKFVELSLDAFAALRAHSEGLVRVAQMVFVNAGHTDESVRRFMTGRSSLNVQDGNDRAVEYLRRLIHRSSRDLGNWFKEFTHERVVPAWFVLLDRGFPPAKALMKLRDAQEQGAADRLAANLQADATTDTGVLLTVDSVRPT